MKDKLRYGNSVIEYTIIKSKRRKTSEIRVDKEGVEVRVPLIKKDSDIKRLVDDKKQWIYKKQLELAYRRKIKPSTITSVSEKYLHDRTLKLASKIGVEPSKIIIKKLKSRWGSATKNGVITLNLTLADMPRKVIDYVIIHELCHLLIRNHSYKFWNLVRKYSKKLEQQKYWLEQNSSIIID
jgi:predicted metal-dependent hydrolase